MMEPEILTLDWEGPVVPSAPHPFDDPDALKIPAVYWCEAAYPTCHVIYIGQSSDLLARVRSHLVATLGLTYWLRDESGSWAYQPGDGYQYLRDMASDRLADLQAMARDTIERQRWYFAHVDDAALKAVEALLIRRLKKLEEQKAEVNGVFLVSENGNLGSRLDGACIVRNRGADPIVDLLGEELVWPLEDAA